MQMDFCASKIPKPRINGDSGQIERTRVELRGDFGPRGEVGVVVGHWTVAGIFWDGYGDRRMLHSLAGPRQPPPAAQLTEPGQKNHPGLVFQEVEAQNRFPSSCRCRSGNSFTCNLT